MAMVSEKAGIDAGRAERAGEAVLGCLRQHPGQLKGLPGMDPDDLVGAVDNKGLGGLFKR